MRNAIILCAMISAVPAAAQTASPAAPAAAPAQAPAPGSAPAAAPAASAQVKAGATVVDASGGQVGMIDQVAGDVVTVNTGTNKVGVPLGNFAAGANGPVLANTKAQLDAAAQQGAAQAQAQLRTLLVPGAAVRGTGGNELGKVKAADAQFVTLTTAKGDVRLPVTGFAAGPNGLVAGMTAAELDAATTAAKAATLK